MLSLKCFTRTNPKTPKAVNHTAPHTRSDWMTPTKLAAGTFAYKRDPGAVRWTKSQAQPTE